MAYGLSNGHVTDNVMWPWKVKLVTPIRIRLECNRPKCVLKTAGFTDRSKVPPIGNGLLAIKWSRDRWRHVTLKCQTHDTNTLRCSTVAGYILATAWLLVFKFWSLLYYRRMLSMLIVLTSSSVSMPATSGAFKAGEASQPDINK